MLKSISSDLDYRNHLRFDISSLDSSQKVRLSQSCFKSALHKLKKLSIDLVADLLRSLYSHTGRPANDPATYIRSFILMQHLGYTSIDLWCDDVAHDSLLQFLIGSSHVPNSSSHYDFIKRLTGDHPHRNILYSKDLNAGKKAKLKKGEKWVNFSKDTTASLIDAYSSNPQWDRQRFSYTLQLFFKSIAVIPSLDLGLIEPKNLVASGDGPLFISRLLLLVMKFLIKKNKKTDVVIATLLLKLILAGTVILACITMDLPSTISPIIIQP